MTELIHFAKLSESSCFIGCGQGPAMELKEHLTFKVPGYKFMPKFKAKLWDGSISLFSEYSNILPMGLVPRAAMFFRNQGYDIQIAPEVAQTFLDQSYDESRLSAWLDSQVIYDETGELIEPYDHQVNASHLLLKHNRVTLLSPTSSGKSLIIYLVTKKVLEDFDGKVLIVVPTTQLVEQMERDILAYGKEDGIPGGVHKIYAGKDKDNIRSRIVVSTWQSIFRLPDSWFDQFTTLFLDEAHLGKAASIREIMAKASKCSRRYALTGTLDDAQAHQFVIEGSFGPVKKFISSSELMEKGITAQLAIRNVIFTYGEEKTEDFWKKAGKDYPSELKFIWKIEERNERIAKLISRLSGNVLALFVNKDHGDLLFPKIQSECLKLGKTKVYKKTGDDNLASRLDVAGIMEKETGVIYAATFGILSTGVSIKNINHVVFCAPVKSKIRVLQSIGRGLRISKTKDSVVLWDIIDNFSKVSGKSISMNHAMLHYFERTKLYEAEKFQTSTTEINLKESD